MLAIDQTPKTRKRNASKVATPRDSEKVKKQIYLSRELARRLSVWAAFHFKSESDVMADLIENHLKGLVVSDRRQENVSDTAALTV